MNPLFQLLCAELRFRIPVFRVAFADISRLTLSIVQRKEKTRARAREMKRERDRGRRGGGEIRRKDAKTLVGVVYSPLENLWEASIIYKVDSWNAISSWKLCKTRRNEATCYLRGRNTGHLWHSSTFDSSPYNRAPLAAFDPSSYWISRTKVPLTIETRDSGTMGPGNRDVCSLKFVRRDKFLFSNIWGRITRLLGSLRLIVANVASCFRLVSIPQVLTVKLLGSRRRPCWIHRGCVCICLRMSLGSLRSCLE